MAGEYQMPQIHWNYSFINKCSKMFIWNIDLFPWVILFLRPFHNIAYFIDISRHINKMAIACILCVNFINTYCELFVNSGGVLKHEQAGTSIRFECMHNRTSFAEFCVVPKTMSVSSQWIEIRLHGKMDHALNAGLCNANTFIVKNCVQPNHNANENVINNTLKN